MFSSDFRYFLLKNFEWNVENFENVSEKFDIKFLKFSFLHILLFLTIIANIKTFV